MKIMMKTWIITFSCYLLLPALATSDAVQPCESPQYVTLGHTGTIQCNFTAGFFGIFWYNTTNYIDEYSVLNLKESGITGPGYTSGEFDIHTNGSLIIREVTLAHNRNFTVVKLDSASEDVKPHFVTVVVQAFPTPPYPVVEGCQKQKSCAIKVLDRGKLECSVLGIHPRVDLAWEVPQNKSSVSLLQTHQNTTRREDGRFDVYLQSEYIINDTSEYSQTIACIAVSTDGTPWSDFNAKVFLLFPEATESPIKTTYNNDVTDTGSNGLLIFLIIFIIVLLLVALTLVGIFFYFRTRAAKADRSSLEEGKEAMGEANSEETPFLENTASTSEGLIQLIGMLKQRYTTIYNATQPIPHLRSKNKNQEKIFIESNLQSLNFREGAGKHGIWENIESVDAVLSDPGFRSKKLILEGDHGYIKSTLGVELANDWCSKERSSFVKEFDVLIYLKLSQLNETALSFKSLSEILFDDVIKIDAKGIEEILTNSSRVGVLLDGFNYCPCGEKGNSLDVVRLISSKLFKSFTVILIAAPSLLEHVYHFNDIKRLRVIGTDEQARERFITKKVGGNTTVFTKSVTPEQDEMEIVEKGVSPPVEIDSAHMRNIPDEAPEAIDKSKIVQVESDTAQEKETDSPERHITQTEENDPSPGNIVVNKVGSPSEKLIMPKEVSLLPLDLLEIPFFYRILSKTYTGKVDHESITKFFSEVIKSLEYETSNGDQAETLGDDNLEKPIQQILHRIAFESVTFDKKQTKFWDKEELTKQMGGKFYESCKIKGYFIEEGVEYNSDNEKESLVIKVRFSNTFFCEWFAAHHIQHMKSGLSSKKEKDDWESLIMSLVSNNYWYCLRFLCGLDDEVAEKVLKHVKGREGMFFFCSLEKNGGIDNSLDEVKKIPSKDIHMKLKDSKLEQMSVIQLLQRKAENQVAIQHLFLEDCFNGPSCSSHELVLRSGLQLPILDTLEKLDLIEEGRTLTIPEAEAIFNYSLRCKSLRSVRFSKCLLPKALEGISCTSKMESRDLQVKWTPLSKSKGFSFDFEKRQWKNKKGALLTVEEYNDVVKDFHH